MMTKQPAEQGTNEQGYQELRDFSFPPAWFEDEVREGFFVSNMMKSYWALQLSVLSKVDEICRRHGLRWFPDSGFLLGIIRHRGFIPWDDDLDIIMYRHELDRFLEIAREELPEEYSIHDIRENPSYGSSIIRIINTGRLSTKTEDLRENQGCPYAAGLDIFVLDGLYENQEEELSRVDELNRIYYADGLIDGNKQDTDEFRACLRRLEEQYHFIPDPALPLHGQLCRLAVQVQSRVPSEGAKVVASFFGSNDIYIFSAAYFSACRKMPFEGILIPVPEAYDEILRVYYGDYTVPKRGGGSHNYPGYRPLERELEAALGHHALRYTLEKNALSLPKTSSALQRIAETMELLERARTGLDEWMKRGDLAAVKKLTDGMEQLSERLSCLLEGRQTTVFLVFRASAWEVMREAYQRVRAEGGQTVHVIPVPWYEKDTDGSPVKRHDERDLFPDIPELTMPEEYDMEKYMPAVIYTCFPYDDSNRCITIDPVFHTARLRNLTDELVYIPYLQPDPPAPVDNAGREAMKTLIEQPAVVYADRVSVGSEEMRQIYTDVLTEIAGEETRRMWEEKIVLCR